MEDPDAYPMVSPLMRTIVAYGRAHIVRHIRVAHRRRFNIVTHTLTIQGRIVRQPGEFVAMYRFLPDRNTCDREDSPVDFVA
jgi:hypothetical protein